MSHIQSVFPKYLPQLTKFFADKRISLEDLVCSARDLWSDEFPFEQFYDFWKCWTLEDVLGQLRSDGVPTVTVVSIGDDEPERKAAVYVQHEMKDFVRGFKIVKMINHPDVVDLLVQLEYIIGHMRDFVQRSESFDITLKLQLKGPRQIAPSCESDEVEASNALRVLRFGRQKVSGSTKQLRAFFDELRRLRDVGRSRRNFKRVGRKPLRPLRQSQLEFWMPEQPLVTSSVLGGASCEDCNQSKPSTASNNSSTDSKDSPTQALEAIQIAHLCAAAAVPTVPDLQDHHLADVESLSSLELEDESVDGLEAAAAHLSSDSLGDKPLEKSNDIGAAPPDRGIVTQSEAPKPLALGTREPVQLDPTPDFPPEASICDEQATAMVDDGVTASSICWLSRKGCLTAPGRPHGVQDERFVQNDYESSDGTSTFPSSAVQQAKTLIADVPALGGPSGIPCVPEGLTRVLDDRGETTELGQSNSESSASSTSEVGTPSRSSSSSTSWMSELSTVSSTYSPGAVVAAAAEVVDALVREVPQSQEVTPPNPFDAALIQFELKFEHFFKVFARFCTADQLRGSKTPPPRRQQVERKRIESPKKSRAAPSVYSRKSQKNVVTETNSDSKRRRPTVDAGPAAPTCHSSGVVAMNTPAPLDNCRTSGEEIAATEFTKQQHADVRHTCGDSADAGINGPPLPREEGPLQEDSAEPRETASEETASERGNSSTQKSIKLFAGPAGPLSAQSLTEVDNQETASLMVGGWPPSSTCSSLSTASSSSSSSFEASSSSEVSSSILSASSGSTTDRRRRGRIGSRTSRRRRSSGIPVGALWANRPLKRFLLQHLKPLAASHSAEMLSLARDCAVLVEQLDPDLEMVLRHQKIGSGESSRSRSPKTLSHTLVGCNGDDGTNNSFNSGGARVESHHEDVDEEDSLDEYTCYETVASGNSGGCGGVRLSSSCHHPSLKEESSSATKIPDEGFNVVPSRSGAVLIVNDGEGRFSVEMPEAVPQMRGRASVNCTGVVGEATSNQPVEDSPSRHHKALYSCKVLGDYPEAAPNDRGVKAGVDPTRCQSDTLEDDEANDVDGAHQSRTMLEAVDGQQTSFVNETRKLNAKPGAGVTELPEALLVPPTQFGGSKTEAPSTIATWLGSVNGAPSGSLSEAHNTSSSDEADYPDRIHHVPGGDKTQAPRPHQEPDGSRTISQVDSSQWSVRRPDSSTRGSWARAEPTADTSPVVTEYDDDDSEEPGPERNNNNNEEEEEDHEITASVASTVDCAGFGLATAPQSTKFSSDVIFGLVQNIVRFLCVYPTMFLEFSQPEHRIVTATVVYNLLQLLR